MSYLSNVIVKAWENRADSSFLCSGEIKSAIEESIAGLESGQLRVAEKVDEEWQVNQWLKQAVLLFFKTNDNKIIDTGFTRFFDKVPLQFNNYSNEDFSARKIRVVPPACVRRGVYVGENTVLMPSYANIGAYIDSGVMVDTWATVGSCAQIGKNVHLSGGVGIGGVLEPLQANPTIIEDNCFVGARSEIVEGVIVKEGAVISMGVYIGQSTKIYDRENDTVTYGVVPKNAVVVPGSIPSKDGKYSLYAAVIVKRVDEKTKAKVGINNLLRDLD